jgi:superfamily II DNA or RNA helicase
MSCRLWPNQTKAIREVQTAHAAGVRRAVVTSPTGGGKSEIMRQLLYWAQDQGWPAVLYSNRKLLLEQTAKGLERTGIDYGIRASGYQPALLRDVQLSSIQTEQARVFKSNRWKLHPAKLVLVDEGHSQTGKVPEKVLAHHVEAGAMVVSFTATPVGMGHLYDHLIQAGVNSELREYGAHVICYTYGPDEPDTRKIKPTATGEFTENDVRKVMMTPTIFARVFDWAKKLNPDWRPAILFAPGVGESIYFAEQFVKKGIPAAHIDGDDIWINGVSYASSPEGRADVLAMSESGEIKVVCNRFVLREAIDMPWLYHGIAATVFGGLSSFLQSGGRLLRSHPTLDHVIWQDHGGSWWRHGSLNADREWRLEYTNSIVAGMRAERMREKKEPEPFTCPECGAVRLSGPSCRACGYQHTRRSRCVVQLDGTLKEMTGDIYKPRIIKSQPDTAEVWEKMYWRARRSKTGMNFNQAYALFFLENHYYPPKDLPLMPQREIDWHMKVKNVPTTELTSTPERKAPAHEQRRRFA